MASSPRRPAQISILDLLIATTLIAAVLGVLSVFPLVAVGALVLLIGAFARTMLVLTLYGSSIGRGPSVTFWLEFVASLTIIFFAGFIGVVILFMGMVLAFLFAKGGGPPIPDPDWVPIIASIFLASAVVAGILWVTRRPMS
jgi:hypothetical protein